MGAVARKRATVENAIRDSTLALAPKSYAAG
jgi:hypothetical protein